jgi:hypothetical protein
MLCLMIVNPTHLIIIKEFNDDMHKQIYYDNIRRITGITDLDLINRLVLTN